ncbi:hypothetical protein Tco_0683050 [Tanacetum coccineum]|uniref:Uncharacterized protein n=1 Tax=Tanacetum coccineum TaxID=301880 RepID=A0ABQ4XUJ0_9ASTR
MDTIKAQQIALDDALVAPANRLKIGKCNQRLSSTLKSNEPTLQVVLDALKLTPFYKAFEITANVPEIYMQEFWATVSIHHKSLHFKMNNKSHTLNLENFKDMLQICPRLPGQKFEDPPLEEEILSFIRDLGHTGEIKVLTDVNVNHMHQPWRSFAAIINRCLSRKTTGLDSLHLSRAQIIWGMYHKKNVDYIYLLWEDLVYQVKNKNSKKNNDMCYPRFPKLIIDYFMTKDQSILRKNKMLWHTAKDGPMFNTIRVISRHQDTQIYGVILPDVLTNQDIKDSKAYKLYYAVASGAKPPKAKTKYMKKADESDTSPKKNTTPATKGCRLKTLPEGMSGENFATFGWIEVWKSGVMWQYCLIGRGNVAKVDGTLCFGGWDGENSMRQRIYACSWNPLTFISLDLGHTGEIKVLTDVNVNHMHQPWRSFAAIINRCLSRKTTGLDSLHLSRAQIIWGMYHKKNVDYIYLLWEDLVYQVKNKNSKKNNDMCYPRFPKLIIDYFMTKDQSISRRNKMFWHTAKDDPMFNTIRVISRHQDTQIYGAILPDVLTNQDMKDSKAYKLYYAVASGAEPPKAKTKYMKKADESDTSPKKNTAPATKGSRLKTSAKVAKSVKKKQPAKKPITKGLTILSEQQNVSSTNKGARDGLEVPDVPEYKSESEEESWTFSQGDDDDNDEETDMNDDSEETESDNDGDNLTHPNLSTFKADDQKEEEEKADDEEVCSDQREEEEEEELYGDLNPNLERRDAEMTDAQTNQDTEDVHVTLTAEPLVSHNLVNVPVSVAAVTPSSATTIPLPPVPIIQTLQQTPDSTTTTPNLITTLPEIHNFASLFGFEQRVSALEIEMFKFKQTSQFAEAVSSIPGIVDNYLASKLKDAVDVAIQLQSNKLREEAQAKNEEFLKHIDSNIKAIIKDQVKAQVSKIMPKVEKYVTKSLGAEVLVRSTNQPQTSYAVAASLLEFELKKILIDKIEENKSIERSDTQKNLYNALVESYNSDKDILTSYGDVVTLKRGRDDQDKDEDPFAGSNRGSKRRRSGKEAELSKEPTHKESKSTSSSKGASRSQLKSSGKSAQAEEHGQKVDDLEEQSHQEINIRNDDATPVREVQNVNERQWNPSSSPTPDREWHTTKTVDDRSPQTWITQLAQAAGTQSSFNEFLATPIDFSAFIMNQLKIENLTQDVLTGLTYDLMKGTCNNVVELEYHLEEVFKATNDQLDWHNPEGRPYPHDLNKPIPLIPNA